MKEKFEPQNKEKTEKMHGINGIEEFRKFSEKTQLESQKSYEVSLERAIETLKGAEGITELKNDKIPTMVISDLHARKDFLQNVLEKKVADKSVYELLSEGKINVVCVGDGMHSEHEENWKQPDLNREMTQSLGTMKMVMELKSQFPNCFHFTRGNHDDMGERMNAYGKFANESANVKRWVIEKYGKDFLEKYEKFEDNLPLIVKGEGLVISHAAPGGELTEEEIKKRILDTAKKLTWTDNCSEGTSEDFIDKTLANIGSEGSTWIIGHRPVEEGMKYRGQYDGKLIQINDPEGQSVAIFQPGKSFNPDECVYDLLEEKEIELEGIEEKGEAGQGQEEVELSDSHPVEETLSLEEDPSKPGQYLEREKESADKKLEALSEELEKARKEYIKNDFEMDRKSKKFSKLFGFRTGLGKYEEEIENYKNNYEESLKNYKDAVIGAEHIKDAEDVEIATRGFVIGERLNRESVRADLEAGEKGWSKTLAKKFSGTTEWYRKLSFKKKLLIGASVAGLGLASSAIGGAAAIGGGSLITGYKVFSWSVSSAGFSDVFEKMAQKGKGKKAEKEVEKIKDSRFEGLESGIESSYEKLKGALDKNIEKIDSKIQKEKGWKVGRRYMGVAAGISMGVLSRYLGKEVAEHFQGEAPEVAEEPGVNSEAIRAGVAGASHNPEYGTLRGLEVNREALEDQVKQALHHDLKFDAPGETAAGVEAAEAVSGVEIATRGDSVWKLAENQLESREYFKSLTGTPEEILAKKTYLIDAIKDKVAENPKDFGMTNANELQIGQKVDFSSIFEDKTDIENIANRAESLRKDEIESITQNLAGKSLL